MLRINLQKMRPRRESLDCLRPSMNAVSQCDRKPFAQHSSCLRCSRKRDVHLVGVIAMQRLNTSFPENPQEMFSTRQRSSRALILRTEQPVRRTTMTVFKTLIVAALVSMTAVASASAQLPAWANSNPAAFQAQYPDRDVLNGGKLTPAGRMGLELPGGAAPVFGGNDTRSVMGRVAR